MSTHKYRRQAGAFNRDKVLSELIVGLGVTPAIHVTPNGDTLTVEVPDYISEALVNTVVNRHSPLTQYQAAALRFGGDAGKMDHAGVVVEGGKQSVQKVALDLGSASNLVINETGQAMTGLEYFLLQQATYYSQTSYAKLGMYLPPSIAPLPAWQLTYQTSFGNDEVLNGDFETGDFTDWTTGGTGTWTVDTTDPHEGIYHAELSGTSGQTGTISPTNRIAMAAMGDVAYEFSLHFSNRDGSEYWTTRQITIDWYVASSGGSPLRTDTFDIQKSTADEYVKFIKVLNAPDTAEYVDFTVTLTRDSTAITATAYLDAIEMRYVGSYSQFTMRPEPTIEGRPLVLEYMPLNTAGVPPGGTPDYGFGSLFPTFDGGLNWFPSPPGLGLNIGIRRIFAGAEAGYLTYDNDNAEHSVYTCTIKAGALGAYGAMPFKAIFRLDNNTGGNRAVDIKVKLGGTTLVTLSTAVLGTGNSRRIVLDGVITNQGNLAVQHLSGMWDDGATRAQMTGDATVDTDAADRTFEITATLSGAASADLDFTRDSVVVHGPHYHAS